MVQRFDAGRLDKAVRTPSGGIRVPAMIGRTGVQTYTDADGSVRREYRPPEEVFSADSLASLGGAPVTVGHPGRVTPANWKRVAVGAVSEQAPTRTPLAGEDFIAAPLVVLDGGAIARIDSGELVEVSAGYSADLDLTPGISPSGEKYDAVQRNVRYNHVAIGPSGWARAGREARLTLDGDENFDFGNHMAEPATIVKLVLDGREVVKGSDEHIAYLDSKVKASEKLVADGQTALGAQTARADAAEAKLKASALTPVQVDALVKAEVAFRSDAVKVLGAEFDFAAKSHRDVQLAQIAKLGGTVTQDASDEFVSAYLAGLVKSSPGFDYNQTKADGDAPPPPVANSIDHFDSALAKILAGAYVESK